MGDIPIIEPTPEPPPVLPGQVPPAPPATPGTPLTGDLAPRAGETAEAYVARLRAGGVEVQRTADAQRAMHTATGKVADLDKKLKAILGHSAVGPGSAPVAPPGTPAPQAPPAAPGAPVAPPATAPGLAQGLEAAAKALFGRYSDTNLNEEQAFTTLFVGTVQAAVDEAMKKVGGDPAIRDRIYGYVTGRARDATRAEAAATEIEGFWKEAAPHAPPELLWSYAEHAARAHPNDPPKQALFCLERGLEAMEKVSAHLTQTHQTTDAIRRGQEAVLPAGGGAPPAPAPVRVPSMIEQMRAARASQPGA